MITKKIKIQIQSGLEARPVAVLVQVASQYSSSIYVEVEDKKVNAKSIMGMMTLGLDAGEEITLWDYGICTLASAYRVFSVRWLL